MSSPEICRMVVMIPSVGAGYGTWEARQRGELPRVKDSLVSCLTPKYERNEWVAVLFDNDSVFTLPGQGEQTNDRCGQWVHPLRCPNHTQPTLEGKKHDSFVATHSCHNIRCPVCYETVISREATAAADRLIQAVGLYRKAGYKIEMPNSRLYDIGRIDHWMFSPPQEMAKELIRTKGGARTLRTMAIRIIKKAGMVGAALMFHPLRQNDGEDSPYIPGIPENAWYVSPHFHVVGCGFIQKSNEFYNETGWTYKKMDRRESIKGTIQYVLSHCGVAEGWQTVTYFGLFSNNKVVIDKIERSTEAVKCKACGEELHLYAIVDTDEGRAVDWSQDLGVYLHIVTKKYYKLRDKMKWVYNPDTLKYDHVEVR